MIRYALNCLDCEAEFEAWFGSSADYDAQSAAGQVACPECESARTAKQIMAPAVARSSGRVTGAEFAAKFRALAARARRHVAENYDYVGSDFAEEARAMYYGETDERPIWGETRPEEARALAEEGVPAAPLPSAFAPRPPRPDEALN